MTTEFFASRVHNVRLVGPGVIRIEFCIAGRNEDGEYAADAPIKPEDIQFAVNVPLQGYLRSFAAMRDFTNQLKEKGMLRPKEDENEAKPQAFKRQASLVDITAEGESSDDSEQEGQPVV